MRVYLHKHDEVSPQVVEIEETATIAVLVEEHCQIDGEAFVMLEETEITLSEELTLVEAGVGDRGHLYVGPRKAVEVTVGFNGLDKDHSFAPAQTVHRAHKWAVGNKGFDLPPDQRPKHVLVLRGTNDRPAADVHLGSLADAEGKVAFDLIAKKRFEG
jgi:hypothetical protein